MVANGTHKSGLSDSQTVKLLQKELDLTKERLQRERAFANQTKAELLQARAQLRNEKAGSEELNGQNHHLQDKLKRLTSQLHTEREERFKLEVANAELSKKLKEAQQKVELISLDYELEFENLQATLDFYEANFYDQRKMVLLLQGNLLDLQHELSLSQIEGEAQKQKSGTSHKVLSRTVRECEQEIIELRKSLTMLELEARSEFARRTAAEFKLQRNTVDSQEDEDKPVDHSQPRLLGARPLSYQKKRAASQRTEKDRKFALPSIRPDNGWIVEAPRTVDISEALNYGIEPSESSVRYTWYQEHFYGQKDNRTYLGGSKEFGPVVISVVPDGAKNWSGSYKGKNPESPRDLNYKAIIRTQDGEDFITFPMSAIKVSGLRSKPSHTDILKFIDPKLVEPELSIGEPSDKEGVIKELLNIEEMQQIKGFKFGVIYCKAGQENGDEMFGNETGSPAFQRFLETIGFKIRLKDWQHFRAGLDTNNDTTGTFSIYTQISSFEVMFHVSTMLPHSSSNKQQLERKRHIGNDIGVIIYREGRQKEGYRPTTIESEFNHVLVVVDAFVDFPDAPDDEKDRFAVSVATKESVPVFGPPLPSGPVFKRNDELRRVILTKLINGEMASLKADAFYSKIRRTRNSLYQNVVDMFPPKS